MSEKSPELKQLLKLKPIFNRNKFQVNKSIRNYKRIYVDKRYDTNGKVYYYDKLREEKVDQKGITLNYWRHATGSETPFKDYNYLNKRNELLILKAADKDQLPKHKGRQALSDLRSTLSSNVYSETSRKIEREYDVKRQLKIKNLEKTDNELRIESSYGSNKEEPEVKEGNTQEDIDKWDLISKVQSKLEINNSDSNKSQIMIGNQKGENKRPADTSPFTYFA